jgi:uncharacterized membrane protein (DUF106 family)
MSGMKKFFIISLIALAFPLLWDQAPIIKDSVHFLLDPSAGSLLSWNRVGGFIIIISIFSIITTILQKYLVDQIEVKRLKKEQKKIQEQVKEHRENPEKAAELTKESMQIAGQMMSHSLRPALFTMIPFILFFKWFVDYFEMNPGGIFGINWIFAYIVISIVFSLFLRKIFKLA